MVVEFAPEQPLRRLRARRRCAVFAQAGVVFIHVPRTAGTSIVHAIYGRFIGHFGLDDLLAVAPAEVVALPRFAIARNPWDRLVSAWALAAGGSRQAASAEVRVHRPGQYAVPAFTSFERFVEEWLPARDLDKRDGIFRPQHHYLTDAAGRIDLTHCGRMENLAATEQWLADTLGRPIALERRNTSVRAAYRDYYTPRLRDMVAQFYAADIALLGYDF